MRSLICLFALAVCVYADFYNSGMTIYLYKGYIIIFIVIK